MDIQMVIKNSKGVYYDISELVGDIEWSTFLRDQPGKLTFDFINDGTVSFDHGSPVQFKVGNKGVFSGYYFTKSHTKDKIQEITCYDQLRYFQNKDVDVLEAKTASQYFEKKCKEFLTGGKYKVITPSSYVIPYVVYDNVTLYEMMKDSIDRTLMNTRKFYTIRDNYGVLEFNDIKNLDTGLVIGDDSLLEDFDYTSSIDEKTYNKIILYKDNKKDKKNRIYSSQKDDNSRAKWGLLQYVEGGNQGLNKAQMDQKAIALLNTYNTPSYGLTLDAIGDLRVFAGSTIYVKISDITDIKVDEKIIVTSCIHSFKNNEHKMKMSVMLERGVIK